MVVFGSPPPLTTKKKEMFVKVGPSLTKLSESAHVSCTCAPQQ